MTYVGVDTAMDAAIGAAQAALGGCPAITYVGLDAAINSLLTAAQILCASAGPEVAAFVSMAGFNTAASIIGGSIVARIAFVQLKRLVPV